MITERVKVCWIFNHLQKNFCRDNFFSVRRLRTERSGASSNRKRDENTQVAEVERIQHSSDASASTQRESEEIFDCDETEPLSLENQYDKLAAAVTPLWNIPYRDQLLMKWKRSQTILGDLKKRLKAEELPSKLKKKCCSKLHKIIPSPVINGYRNKDEFRIKRGVDGNPKTVGLLVGNLSKGTAVCVNPDNLINTKASHKKIARCFQNYIRQSPLPMCDLFSDGGYWRGISVRSTQGGEIMAIVTIHPQMLTENELDREKNLLTSYFSSGEGKECNLTSLYFQACRHTRCTSEQAPYQLLFGKTHIYETLGVFRFRISPDSFFQVNTAAAEYLSKTITQLCGIDEDTVLLDICSGTGILSLPLASQVRAVIGIELNKHAVEDANINAEINNVKNATFVVGRAEHVLPQLVSSFHRHKLIAVMNPTRAGLQSKVIQAVRECKTLHQVVYVSCKPEGEALLNFYHLGKPSSGKLMGEPFIPTKAVPLDMFPHTEHCELIVLLERMGY